jgi:hypothetical protein
MPSPVQITITSVCKTSKNLARLSPSGDNQIQWQAAGKNTFTLTLPKGVFQGHDGAGTFKLTITGTGFQPATPLTLVLHPTAQLISNYIYQNGSNCSSDSPPPDIVIDAS